MAIITISMDSYSRGGEVAALVAGRLGYRCIAREVVSEASRQFNIPETRLIRAINDAPSVFERFSDLKEKYFACFRAALLKQFRLDNIVYHGRGGILFARGLKHTLKVRIFSDTETRVSIAMERNKTSREQALRILRADDEELGRWGRRRFGTDMTDPGLYDLVVNVGKLTVDDAAALIGRAAGMERFRTTEESSRAVWNLALAAEVKATLFEIKPDARVCADDGKVYVGARLPAPPSEGKTGLVDEMRKLVQSVPGVEMVDIRPMRLTGKTHHFLIGSECAAGACC